MFPNNSRFGGFAAAPTSLHIRMSCGGELTMSQMLISKGLQPGADAPTVLQNYTCSFDRFWMAERLLKSGMEVRQNDYLSLDVCMRNGAADAAKLLLDQGVDFDQYQAWAEKHSHSTITIEKSTSPVFTYERIRKAAVTNPL